VLNTGIEVLHQFVNEVHWCSSSSTAADEGAAVMQQMQLLLMPAIHSSRPDDAACVHVWNSKWLPEAAAVWQGLAAGRSAQTPECQHSSCTVRYVSSGLCAVCNTFTSVTPPEYALLYSRAAVFACALLCALGPAQLLETVNHVDRPAPESPDGYSLPGRQPKVLVE
jgi:hypothetical protein